MIVGKIFFAIIADMDTRNDKFLHAVLNKSSRLLYHSLRSNAARRATGIRNQAITAKAIAAILDFNKGAGSRRAYFRKERQTRFEMRLTIFRYGICSYWKLAWRKNFRKSFAKPL